MSSDATGGAGWTRPSWFSPASDAIARGSSSASARAGNRRRQRSRGDISTSSQHNQSRRRSSMAAGDTNYDEDSELGNSGSATTRSAARGRRHRQRPAPTLTVILMRLEASMSSYCTALSKPSGPNARKAARVLDVDNLGVVGAADPILEAEWVRMVDPLTLLAGAEGWYGGLEHLAQQKQKQKQHKSVASTNDKAAESRRQRSRIKRGTMMATDGSSQRTATSSSTSTTAAGVSFSGKNAGMPTPSTHDDDNNMRSSLSPEAERIRSIYGKVMKDLGILREILCDPIVMAKPAAGSGESETPQDSMRTEQPLHASYLISPAQISDLQASSAPGDASAHASGSTAGQQQQAAESLSKTLATLMELCKVRREMIGIHSDIVALGSARMTPTKDETTGSTPASPGSTAVEALHSSLLGLADRCCEIHKTLPEDASTSSPATAPMVEAMRHEIAATKAALRMMAHLETCSFFETVLEVKRLETHLCPSSQFHSDLPSALEMWLRQMFREGLSLMSIYYDRIDAYANSSLGYGFQRHIMVEDKTGQQQLSKVPSAVAAADSPSPVHPLGSPSPSSQGMASYSGQRQPTWYGQVHDLDSEAIELLHLHEERNGPALAVALLFDTKNCSGAFERGFSVNRKEEKVNDNSNETSSSSGTEKASWSPVYLRTSTKSGDPDFESKLDAGNDASFRRGGQRRVGSKGMSLSNLLSSGTENQGGLRIKRPSYGGNTSRGSLTSIVSDISLGLDGSEATKVVSPMVKAAEYGFLQATTGAANEIEKPSSSPITWPHSEMEGIVSILQSDNNDSTKEASHSPHPAEPQRDTRSKNISPKFVASIHTPTRPPRRNNPFNFSPLIEETEEQSLNESVIASPVRSITASATSPLSPPSGTHHLGSSYHLVQIQEGLWLSVIIKGDGEGGRHRRRSSRGGLTDEEIRMWLGQFAAKLPLSKMFCPKSVASARKISKGLSLPAVASSASRAVVTSDEAVLMSLKESFGMKHSSSPLASRPLKSPYVRKERLSFRGNSIRSGTLPEQLIQDEGTSAAAFFLGADLGQVLSPERYGM